MASILGSFLFLSIALNTGWEILSAGVLKLLNSGIFRFSTAFEKNEFRNSASLFCFYVHLPEIY